MRSELAGCLLYLPSDANRTRKERSVQSCGAAACAYPIDCQDGREAGDVTTDSLYGECLFDSHVTTWTLLGRADEGG